VLAGIAAVQPCAPALIAIHDGARPLVTSHLISRCLGAACQHRAAIAAAPSSDTLKQVRDGMVVSTLDRSSIWRAQTPQVFETELICEAYSRAGTEACHATDDAALVERLGVSPVIVDSDWTNVKITTPDDVIIAEALLRHRLNHWEGRSTLQ
jgi:2-C-methyl-D-erythritol 4-phosphate cytidylyltransferase